MYKILAMILCLCTFAFTSKAELVPLMKSDGSTSVKHFQTQDPVMTPSVYEQRDAELRALWVAAVTSDVVRHTSKSAYQTGMRRVIRTLLDHNMNTLIYQVRPTSDAFYSSALNPWSKYLMGMYSTKENEVVAPDWDPFEWLIEECHKNDIEIHAWFNPYRVTTAGIDAGISKEDYINENLSPKNFAYKHPEYTVLGSDRKILFNPGEREVIDFVTATVMEVVENYDVDGIHFDDYFYSYEGYPVGFDNDVYQQHKKPSQSIDDFRRENVDILIEGIGRGIRNYNAENGKKIVFGISPFGIWDNKANNPLGSPTAGTSSYRTCYADTRKWVKLEWIDYIMPQVYWHFEHSIAPYADIVDWWVDVVKDTNVNLYIGHGMYKYVQGAVEWKNSPNELAMQLNYNTKYKEVKGSSFFSYFYIRDMYNAPTAWSDLTPIKNVIELIDATMWTNKVPVSAYTAPSSIESASAQSASITVYFNSDGNALNVNLDRDMKNGTLTLFDLSGRIITSQPIVGQTAVVNTSLLEKGLYVLQLLENGKATAGVKVVK